jgi:large subunit ribosomal protein L6
MHGLTRTLIDNMIKGVVTPFKKSLEISGLGYRAELKGSFLNLQVGLSHEVDHPIPPGVTCTVEKQVAVNLSSPDKELLGQTAAEIRSYRTCEPYKGKGVKYTGERILRKEGKTGAA